MKHTIVYVLFALMCLSCLFFMLPAPSVHGAPTILYVKPGGMTIGPCEMWVLACELRYALTIAVSGQEIWVAAGTYKPTDIIDPGATFQLVNGVAIYGGFAMTETLRTQRNPATHIVVLSGDIDNNDTTDVRGVVTTTTNLTGTNSYHVVKGANDATLDGVMITAGNANGNATNSDGGGVYNYYSSPTLTNVTFSGNSASSFGGGMGNEYSSPTLTNVTFSGNSANSGGGMDNFHADPTLTNVTFSGNSASDAGGGMHNNYSSSRLTNVTFSGNSANWGGGMYNVVNSSPRLTNVIFSGNSASNGGGMLNANSNPNLTNVTFSGNSASNGGGIYNYNNSRPTLINVTFSGNSATYGGGMHNENNSSPTLVNVTFNGNSASISGGGMSNWSNSTPQVLNSILWNDNGGEIYNDLSTPGILNSVVQGGCPAGNTCTNVMTANPLLGAFGNYGSNMQTIPLLPGSSAIHATNENCPPTDERGIGRGSTCDLGAFESQGFTLTKTGGDNQSAFINTAFTTPLSLSITSAYSEPVAGGILSFTAPTSSASIAAPTTFSKTISANGQVTATVTANGNSGLYNVTASASGAPSVNFALTNLPPLLYAKPGGALSGLCDTWDNACELRYALASTISNQEIWVAAGTYKPTAATDRNATFQLTSGVAIYGGFAGTETARSQRDWITQVVTLSGDIGISGNNSDNVYHVVTGADGATLDGVTITAGNANGDGATAAGGGMYNVYSSLTVRNVTFSGNMAFGGGGMYNYSSYPNLTNITFSANSASSSGGGIYNDYSDPTLTNVTFNGNSASGSGGGIHNYYSNPTLTNVTLSGNSSSIQGGGMYNESNSKPQVRNAILWNDSGGEIFNADASSTTMTNSVVQGGCPAGSTCTNVMTANPLLGTLANNGGSTQTMALASNSPAIDAGNSAYCPATDQRGYARDDLRCDLGAFERKMTDGNWVALIPSTTSMTTYGPPRVGIQDLGSTHPGIITATKVTNWAGGTPSGTLGAWWDLAATPSAGLNLNLALCYSSAEQGNLSESGAHFWRYSGGTWYDAGAVASFTGTSPNRCATISNVSGLSRWTVANNSPSGGAPTVVLLMRWVAIPQSEAMRLEWQTMLDLQVSTYQVERALDGKTFTPLGNPVQPMGGGIYTVYDTMLPRGLTATYRLIALKTNGTREILGTIQGALSTPFYLPLIKK